MCVKIIIGDHVTLLSMSGAVAVVALGGNALQDPLDSGGINESRLELTARLVGFLAEQGYSVVVTHGNGPQVGEIHEAFLKSNPSLSTRLDVLVAMTQGQLGYLLAKSIGALNHRKCVAVCTTVVVSEDDPAFLDPSKPIGRYLDEEEWSKLSSMDLKFKSTNRGGKTLYRQVVPSPYPRHILELDAIRALLESGHVVVACGGGGIPVIRVNGAFRGVNAVVDKDLASSLLARELKASVLIILTAVESVLLDYGKPNQQPIRRLSVAQAERYLSQGVFEEGTMAPKIRACVDFTKATSHESLITSPEALAAALKGIAGTHIVP